VCIMEYIAGFPDYSRTPRITIYSITNQSQVTCGSELAVIFVETLVKAKVPYDDDVLG